MSSPLPVRHLRDETSKPITRLATDIPLPAMERGSGSTEAAPDEVSLNLGAEALLEIFSQKRVLALIFYSNRVVVQSVSLGSLRVIIDDVKSHLQDLLICKRGV